MLPVLLPYTGPVDFVDGVEDEATGVISVNTDGVLYWICGFEVSVDETGMALVDITDVISVTEDSVLIWIGDFVDDTIFSIDGSDMGDKPSWQVEQHTWVR